MNTSWQDEEFAQEVLEAKRAWVEVHRRLDIDTLDRLMADEE